MADHEQIRQKFNTDPFAVAVGVSVTEVSDGYAVAEAEVSGEMANTISTAHGGLIFAVADEAFAAASNSDNMTRVAQHVSISFTRPAVVGQMLRATAKLVTQTKNTAIYHVEVSNEQGKIVASCQCVAYSLGTPYIADPE